MTAEPWYLRLWIARCFVIVAGPFVLLFVLIVSGYRHFGEAGRRVWFDVMFEIRDMRLTWLYGARLVIRKERLLKERQQSSGG